MIRMGRRLICLSAVVLLLAVLCRTGFGVQIELKDGRILSGKLGYTAGLAEAPQPLNPDGSGPLLLIWFIDDDLRRTYFSFRQIQSPPVHDDPTDIFEKFPIRQRTMRNGPTVRSVGSILRVQPFDEYGRRIFTMSTTKGPTDVIQAITEITPIWTKVEGVTHVWDLRMATSSLPKDVLAKILTRQIEPGNIEHRKKIARFYLQSERYQESYSELEKILTDFPDQPDIRQQLEPSIRALKQLRAKRLLSELELRRDAGQHDLAIERLKTFPSEDVAGEILQAVREMIQKYEGWEIQRTEILEQFATLLDKVEETAVRQRLEPVLVELDTDLGFETLGRMASFRQMATDDGLPVTNRLSLAVSGWLLGGDSATLNLPVSLSVYDVRSLVRQYLNANDRLTQARILKQFYSQEGATPELVAKLIANMKPPVETPSQAELKPGFYELEVPALGNSPPVKYQVQLPPEYNPLRRYPTILTLHGAGSSAELQIDWWAGALTDGGWRSGQAARHGYIVVAPNWCAEHQKQYQYSAAELAAVMNCFRDACRRFSVDTDRVFLSGHSMGGDASWDLGLAHPDLWAGVIPIVARADRYSTLYWENAELLPFYVVGGELDGDSLIHNALSLDRYLRRGYNTTVVEYLGRGHENFSDEVHRIFDWMGRFQRDFFPREFAVSTMRPWDNFFWWVELADLPTRSMVHPPDWPPPRGTLPAETKASITPTGGIYLRTGAGKATVYLSPEVFDFDNAINVAINGRRLKSPTPLTEADIESTLATLLEDVRTRADRQHPFWLKVETPTGRISGSQ